MMVLARMTLDDLGVFIRLEILNIIASLVIVVVITIAYKLISRSLSKMAEKVQIEPHIENTIRLVLRVCSIAAATALVFSIFELPTTWFLGSSAIIGAALGFGSSQTINNIVAGFYVIISRPFKVKDYVKIDDVEGQVEEITINYTKLYTPTFNLLEVPNIQVMNSKVLNCTHEGYIRYTFTLDLPHSMTSSNEELESKCLQPSIDEFHEKHRDLQLRKPEFYFESSGSFSRSFKIRIFIPKGEARTLYSLKPELSNMIINKWDILRKK
jgi:small conductance mechanosensitive channel